MTRRTLSLTVPPQYPMRDFLRNIDRSYFRLSSDGDVQYIVRDNEGHGFANEENRFEFCGAMEAFFAKHLKP